jgi:hypothetical protein
MNPDAYVLAPGEFEESKMPPVVEIPPVVGEPHGLPFDTSAHEALRN